MPNARDQAVSPHTFPLLRLLVDGKFHSGETLARHLGISRASVSNALRRADDFGLRVFRIRGRGYCLNDPPQWLDAERIQAQLGTLAGKIRVDVLDHASSSNTLLLQRAARGAPSGSVLAVEWQSAGRGRMGRTWHSGLGSALTFSMLWRFDQGLAALSGLSLAVGVALIRTLRRLGLDNAALKWPNDVLGSDGKLAGILIEAQGDMLGPSMAVIGIGLNMSLPQRWLGQIDQPATSLKAMAEQQGGVVIPDRNVLLALILAELNDMLDRFSAQGFETVKVEWERYHALHNRAARLLLPDGASVAGTVRGVSREGALVLETERGTQMYHAGEVSVRAP